ALPPTMRRRLAPLLGDGSDSVQLDRLVEALTLQGVPPVQVLLGLVPEAHAATPALHPRLRAWYRLQGALREPWDGPAGLLYCDDRWAIAHLDRNGLRPLFVEETGGNGHPAQMAVSSEQGVTAHQHDDIIFTHQLGPGEIVALDRQTGRCYHDKEVKAELIALTADWEQMLERHVVVGGIAPPVHPAPDAERFLRLQLAAGVTQDDLTYFLLPMVRKGKEAVFSMGDDTQLTPFVARPRLFADHLRQRFAQVTNPPIDPYREGAVFDTTVYLGRLEGFFGGPLAGRSIALESPVLSAETFAWVLAQSDVCRLSTVFPVADGVEGAAQALDELERAAVEAVRAGAQVIVLSDRQSGVDEQHAALPMALAIGAVHQRLIAAGLRARAGLAADAADAWHEHHLAVLLGLGADAVHPWMALRWAEILGEEDEGVEADPGGERLRHVLLAGVVKVMSKMGICAASSYVGSQLFEALGLEPAVVERCCPGVARWGSGVGFADLVDDVIGFHQAAWAPRPSLAEQGFVRFRKGGLPRAFEPRVFSGLPKVVAETAEEMECYAAHEQAPPEEFVPAFLRALNPAARGRYAAWAAAINGREPITVGDRYEIVSERAPIPIDEVEPVWKILDDREGLGRICGGAMSWGSLSDEAHEDIAVAMNRLGAKSNTGEGGERSHRYGGPANSATKQVASARFGVTPQYLYHLHEWQIKMAQGSKPGEGGQLPGHKVSRAIAEVRGSNSGVELISPPPHHDIYSIEDLAELMYELTQFNPTARGNVKLVSETGVAIVAAGVAKGGAQTVHISGHSGGTGASPLSSIKFAGLPWELGVQAAHQVLQANDLRDRVKLVIDGGLQTGVHAVKAFLLGAEAVGLGSILLVAEGCIMARQCHLNSCPTGIATQSKRLRAKYAGKPVHLVKYLLLFAEEIRQTLACMGYRSVSEIVGRTDLLCAREDVEGTAGRIRFDGELLGRPLPLGEKRPTWAGVSTLNQRLLEEARPALTERVPATLRYTVNNTDRAVGATLAGQIVAATGTEGLSAPIDVELEGYAGQALGFGIWGGLRLILRGRANDYVGKAMSTGGLIAVRPPDSFGCPPESTSLVGNTVGYGATGGELYVAGRAGQRFMCRNSGAVAVVEGVGPHGCEYMTKGIVVVLGPVGLNFAAGMTGGVVYLIDGFTAEERGLLNTDYVRVEPLTADEASAGGPLYALVAAHHRWTGSPLAAEVLRYWPFYARYRFDK
ncbi:MAG TPA: glutamate synthase-related protein, partial [Chloroflexota bacterium]|nr:glutamate synthase-related protein [Chloroflexota bacterium]